jgi:cobalt/nickel transport system permease protein
MHMADALLSPAVGGAMWLASAAALTLSARRLRAHDDDRLVPLMGVLGAFVFAAQMINFAIPGTGSSGHLGGGLLLAVLLGPHAALVVIASVLAVQALFFADGGLLALGANIFNLGVLPCWVAYPLVYRLLAGEGASRQRIGLAAVAAGLFGLQLGALAVVLETVASGITSLPLHGFLWLMLPIHLPIGLVEGVATAAILGFIRHAQPELLATARREGPPARPAKRLLVLLAVAAGVAAAGLSALASSAPDGLEWAIEKTAGRAVPPEAKSGLPGWLAKLQQQTVLLPDYQLPGHGAAVAAPAGAAWPQAQGGTAVAGLAGGTVTLLVVGGIVALLRRRRR